jgi:hypothetical protein
MILGLVLPTPILSGYACPMNFILLALFPLLSHALTFEVVGPCQAKPVYSGAMAVEKPMSAGRATLEILNREGIPFVGSESGLNSILGTPTGLAAIEVLSEEELRAYGWCYEVDGRQPAEMPGELILRGTEHLRWFYAFSLSRRDVWVSYCEPAHTVKPETLCGVR